MGEYAATGLPSREVLRHVVDAHCHPLDASAEAMKDVDVTIALMSMTRADQSQVCEAASASPDKVIPFFGYHPWWSHYIALAPAKSKEDHYRGLFLDSQNPSPEQLKAFQDLLPHLPDPTLLEDALQDLRQKFRQFPSAHLGEVGLDKIFRVPHDYYASPRVVTPFNIPIDHQVAVFEAQVDLAVELGINVSVHSVRAQMPTVDVLNRLSKKHGEKWYRISIDMHSCGLSPQMWKDVQKKFNNVFLSVSVFVNKRSPNHAALISACSDDRILVESDMNEIDACVPLVWEMLVTVAEVKGWSIEEKWEDELEQDKWGAVRKLENNWKVFLAGNHKSPVKRENHHRRKLREYEEVSDEE